MTIEYWVNRVFSSRTYILREVSYDVVWLVDIGDTDHVLSMLGVDERVGGVLLTHAHYDHIYGLPSLLKRFPGCKVYTNAAGVEALGSPKMNMSRYHEDPIALKGDCIVTVGEGDLIPLSYGVVAQVLETPGHNPSCLSFLIENRIFTGDAYIPGEKVVTTLPGGDKELAASSQERIMKLSVGREVFPGHDMRNSLI